MHSFLFSSHPIRCCYEWIGKRTWVWFEKYLETVTVPPVLHQLSENVFNVTNMRAYLNRRSRRANFRVLPTFYRIGWISPYCRAKRNFDEPHSWNTLRRWWVSAEIKHTAHHCNRLIHRLPVVVKRGDTTSTSRSSSSGNPVRYDHHHQSSTYTVQLLYKYRA